MSTFEDAEYPRK